MKFNFIEGGDNQYNNLEQASEIISKAENIYFYLTDLKKEFGYRQMVYWFENGALLQDPKKERLMNVGFFEYCWIRVVALLRSFSVDIKKIKQIRDEVLRPFNVFKEVSLEQWKRQMTELLNLPKEEQEEFMAFILQNKQNEVHTEITMFHFAVISVFTMTEPCYLYYGATGNIAIVQDLSVLTNEEYKEVIQALGSSYIRISIVEAVISALGITKTRSGNPIKDLLSEGEYKIIQAIRKKEAQSITIKFDKDGAPSVMEETVVLHNVENASRLLELIIPHGYQSIELKTQDGKISHCVSTRKTKLFKGTSKEGQRYKGKLT